MSDLFSYGEHESLRNLTPEEKVLALDQLAKTHEEECPHCSPRRGHLNMVFGEGNSNAKIMFVGEGPGEEEDKQGRPFVGRAGKLLDKQIEAINLRRGDVYIANIVKTRPPDNRIPTPEEVERCIPYLKKQVSIVSPNVIVALGATSAKYLLLRPLLAITKVRGTWHEYENTPLMPTFHPAYLLRAYTPENRALVWEDLKAARERAYKEEGKS